MSRLGVLRAELEAARELVSGSGCTALCFRPPGPPAPQAFGGALISGYQSAAQGAVLLLSQMQSGKQGLGQKPAQAC